MTNPKDLKMLVTVYQYKYDKKGSAFALPFYSCGFSFCVYYYLRWDVLLNKAHQHLGA